MYGTTNKRIPLPSGVPSGAIIGRGGRNIRLVQQRSGARVFVDNTANVVKVSGAAAAVEAATALINAQIEAIMSSGTAITRRASLASVIMISTSCFCLVVHGRLSP